MITDTAFYRYPHYHRPSDTPDKLAYPELTWVTAGLFAAFAKLARGGVGSGGLAAGAMPILGPWKANLTTWSGLLDK
jgi:hypothetical protein